MIRRIDFVLNESIRRAKDNKLPKIERQRAVGNLFKLLGIITLTEGTVDIVKAILRGDEVKLDEIVSDNPLRFLFLSKYDVSTIKREGLGKAIANKLAPSIGVVSDIGYDLVGLFTGKPTAKTT